MANILEAQVIEVLERVHRVVWYKTTKIQSAAQTVLYNLRAEIHKDVNSCVSILSSRVVAVCAGSSSEPSNSVFLDAKLSKERAHREGHYDT